MNKLAAAGWGFRAFLLAMFALLSACGGNDSSERALVSVNVNAPVLTLAKGEATQFTATASYSDGATEDVSSQVSWGPQGSSLVSVGTDGLVTALSNTAANVSITATLGTVTGAKVLALTPRRAVELQVSPAAETIAKGLSKPLQATLIFTDSTQQDVTATAVWSSATPSVATVSAGTVTAVNVGNALVKAVSAGFEDTASITVTNAVPVRIEVSPKTVSIARGLTQQLAAVAVLSDGTTATITQNTAWTSDSTSIATVGNSVSPLNKGLVSADNVGTTTIRANFFGLLDTATIVVTQTELTAIEVSPTAISVPVGTTRQLAATAISTDQSTKPVTQLATWTSLNSSVATVSPDGLVTGLLAGSTTIKATYSEGFGASTITREATVAVTVTQAVLREIEINPSPARLAKGGYQIQYTATGVFTDDSTTDLTNSALWASSNEGAATISNAAGSKGLLTSGDTAGATLITAKMGSVSSAGRELQVTNAVIAAILIDPATTVLALGQAKQFKATAVFTGSTPSADVTDKVTWASTDQSIATISNAAGSNGFSVSQNVGGPINIIASLNGVTGTATLEVQAAELVAIEVSPAASTLRRGFDRAFVATGTFSNGSVSDVTNSVVWSSSDSNVATVSNALGSEGLVHGGAVGTTTITAVGNVLGGGTVQGSTALTVTDAALTQIQVSPASTTVPLGGKQQLMATGIFADGAQMDLTEEVTWKSSDTNVATVSNAASSRGSVTGRAQGGPIVITAVSGAVSGTAQISVSETTITSLNVRLGTTSCAAAAGPEVDLVLPRGFASNVIACARFTDGLTRDVSGQVVWTTGAASVATVGNDTATKGIVTSVGEGRTVVIASLDGFSDSQPVQTTLATLVSIAAAPATATIAGGAGNFIQYTAVGTFSDTSTLPITAQVTWSSSGPWVAISNAAGSQGRATPAQNTLISRSITISATRDAITGTAALTRTP